jgi:hypothetical protein
MNSNTMKYDLKGIFIGLICLFCFTFFTNSIWAQSPRKTTTNQNGWYMYFGDHKFSEKWGIHLEAQFRRANIITDPQQLLLRTGINYHPSKSSFFTLGYCFVNTYPYGGYPVKCIFPENRFWEQYQVKTQLNTVEWVSRFRLEQRFSKLPIPIDLDYMPGDAVYTNRFRMMNRFSVPLKGKSITDKSFYISGYDEVFINFGKHVGYNTVDQNRAYMAIGYKIPKVGRLEVGYLNQLVFKSDGIKVENNQTIQVGLSSNTELFKKK